MRILGALQQSRHMIALAVEYEHTTAHGRMLGLSDEETAQVIGAWSDHHRSRLDPLNWGRVREALTSRALGEKWRP